MRPRLSLQWAVIGLGFVFILVAVSYWVGQRRAHTLVEVAAEEVLKNPQWRPKIVYVAGQDPSYVVDLLKRGSIAGVRIEPTSALSNPQGPFDSPSGAEMKLIITAIEPKNSSESDIIVSYYFGPTDGEIARLSAIRGVFGWNIVHTEIEKVR